VASCGRSGTYKTRSGICKTADTLGFKVQIDGGQQQPRTTPSQYARRPCERWTQRPLGTSAYYMHPTMGRTCRAQHLDVRALCGIGSNGPTFEGFPIKWVGVMPIYDTPRT